ncbi:MAG: penicillin-binding protein 2 [Candidatus Berkelbacteria bacterium]|nr:penicillin-binding protein 2 [Candidatus Berkelbacteria bacterium]
MIKKNKKSLFEIFPSFLPGKKRYVKSTEEVDVELGSSKEEVVEEKVIVAKKYYFTFYILAALVFLMLFAKLFQLQIVLGQQNRIKAEENRLRIRVTQAPRGVIYDRNKKPLLKNVASFSVEMYPTDLPKKQEERTALYQQLSSVLNIPLPEFEKVESKRSVQEPAVLKDNVPQEEAILLGSKIANLPATKVEKRPSRQYLKIEFSLAHILGYTGKISEEELKKYADYNMSDSIGKSGLEESYEKYLKGEDGKQRVEVDSSGKVVRILDSTNPIPGNSLVLSLDLGLQEQMTKSLEAMIKQSKANGGVAIAADPRDGSILGFVSLPSYDNNLFVNGIKKEDYDKLINDKKKPLFDRITSAMYPPGSIIKPIMASAALTEKVITPQTTISDPGIITIVNKYNPSISYNFPDWKPGGHGKVDVTKAIEQSCDIFFYAVGGGWQNISGLGEKRIADWLSKFNIDKKPEIDITGAKAGFVPTASWKEQARKEPWSQGDSYHVAIGQGDLLVTPLHVLDYTIYFANGGTFYKPQFVSQIEDLDGNLVQKIEPEVVSKDIVPKNYMDIVREGMHRVTSVGTARSLADLPFSVAGKTGTAQNPHGEPHAWFISFAPFENPQIATVVLLENGGEGSSVAVPVTKDILKYWWDNVKK